MTCKYDEYDPKAVGDRIKTERKKLYRSREKFAEDVEKHGIAISAETLKNWESGKVTIDIHSFIDLCNLFKCDIDYLLCRQDYRTKEIESLTFATGLSEKSIDTLLDIKSHDDFFNMLRLQEGADSEIVRDNSHSIKLIDDLLNIMSDVMDFIDIIKISKRDELNLKKDPNYDAYRKIYKDMEKGVTLEERSLILEGKLEPSSESIFSHRLWRHWYEIYGEGIGVTDIEHMTPSGLLPSEIYSVFNDTRVPSNMWNIQDMIMEVIKENTKVE